MPRLTPGCRQELLARRASEGMFCPSLARRANHARRATNRRSGFTLLEVVLAIAIALLLMAGFYVAVQMHLDLMQAGRDAVEEGSLARGLLMRMESDIAPALAPVTPPASSSSGTTDPASGTTTTTTSTNTGPVFSIGVKGDGTTLSVYITRLSRATITPPQTDETTTGSTGSDIRRITYFLDGDRGLIRQEVRMVTADNPDDPASTNDVEESRAVLAEEVSQLEFRYFDGSSWVDSWDGAALGADGKTPLGPPRAVEITVAIRTPGGVEPKTYVHVVAFQTAPGAPSSDSTTTTP